MLFIPPLLSMGDNTKLLCMLPKAKADKSIITKTFYLNNLDAKEYQ